MKLLNFATVILIWLMGIQYLINNFIAPSIKEKAEQKGKRSDEAEVTKNKFIRACQWVILFLFIFVIIIATIGYLSTLKAN